MQNHKVSADKQEYANTVGVNYFKTIVIIPAYNEERFIGSVVIKAHKLIDTVIVVDDGSSDATAEIAETAGAIVLHHKKNMGKAAALNTGFQYVRNMHPDIVIAIDADGQHVPEEMQLLAEPIIHLRADIVVGSRYLDKSSSVPVERVWGHRLFNFMINHTSGTSLSDSQSGFRAFSRHAIECMNLSSSGFTAESEMQFLAHERELHVVEVPITIHYTDKPKRSVWAHGLIVLRGVIKLISEYRPLFYFGMSGLALLIIAFGWSLFVVNIYSNTRILAVGYSLIAVFIGLAGIFTLFTGFLLHAIRSQLLHLFNSKEASEQDTSR